MSALHGTMSACLLVRMSLYGRTTYVFGHVHVEWPRTALRSAKVVPSSIRGKRKTDKEKLTLAVTDLHSNANQAPVANHNRATLLREHYFSCMFACSGSFQLPSVRHATPITRSTRSLAEAGRRDASLICSHARAGSPYWLNGFGNCFFL